MSHHPFDPDELGRGDPELERVARELEAYATSREGQAPVGLESRILAAIDAEPDPARGWWVALLAGPRAWNPVGQLLGAAAVVVVAVAGALAVGQVIDGLRPDIGATPPPSPVLGPSEETSPTTTPPPTSSATPSPSPTPVPTPTLQPTQVPTTSVPTASDDDSGSPEPSERPEPSESDHSGPGGGGGDD
jgi:hypothetical protein